jgi:hypothetical protein
VPSETTPLLQPLSPSLPIYKENVRQPIKFPSSPLSREDDLPAHQSSEEDVSSDDWRPSDYSPPWSSEKEDPKEEDKEDKDEDDAEDENDNSDSDDVGVLEQGVSRDRTSE